MRRHLLARGVDEREVEQVLVALVEQGYLDDTRYAQRFAEDRRVLDGWGSERIEQRLRAMGIGDRACERALAPVEDQEAEAALALLQRRLRRAPDDDRERQRALSLLVRKGYELELAYEAVRRFERDAEEAVRRFQRDPERGPEQAG
jgi:regulatory protein